MNLLRSFVTVTLQGFQRTLAQIRQLQRAIRGLNNIRINIGGGGLRGGGGGARGASNALRQISLQQQRQIARARELASIYRSRLVSALRSARSNLVALGGANANPQLAAQIRDLENRLVRLRTALSAVRVRPTALRFRLLASSFRQAAGQASILRNRMQDLVRAARRTRLSFINLVGRISLVLGLLGQLAAILRTVARATVLAGRAIFNTLIPGFLQGAAAALQFIRRIPQLAAVFTAFAARDLVRFRNEFNSVRLLFGQAFGGNAQRELDGLRQTADDLGVRFSSLAPDFGRFAVAVTAAGNSAEDARNLFTGLSRAGVSLGLSSARLNRTLLAFEQIAGSSTLRSEEFTRQLRDSFPQAMGIAARSLGITVDEFRQQLEGGLIQTTDFLPRFAQTLNEEFEATAAAAGRFPAARLARIANQVDRFREVLSQDLAGPIVGLIEGAVRGVRDLFGDLDLGELSFRVGEGLRLIGQGLRDAIGGVSRQQLAQLRQFVFQVLINGIRGATFAFAAITGAVRGFFSIFGQLSGESRTLDGDLRSLAITIGDIGDRFTIISAQFSGAALSLRVAVETMIVIRRWITDSIQSTTSC